ncbi:universal stress protein [Actinomadura sp. HBU206391]|uniref:universal stress protein n=1 Tax=Actinomadura sp. HBU206391 TaxID=2731692 RepID=UPI00164F54D4|nr:universal stress protein [Actinomadura sp. HBU206391]MBC6463589.1 universal stress protein [Actinomadura sp. HBU206391]
MARRSILIGVDGSPPSDAALRWAAHEASLRGVGLCLVHAFAWSLFGVDVRRSLSWGEAHRMVAGAHRKAEKIAPSVHVRSEVVTDSPSIALIQRSAEAGLVVLGTRGHGGFRDLLAGSVALQVAGHASCPVVLVHAGWRPPIDDRQIVVVVGGDTALQAAFGEAELRGIRLRAIRAWRPIMPTGPIGRTAMGAPLTEIERDEENLLIRALVPWRKQHPGVRIIESVTCDSSRHALIEASRKAELLVVGAREHFGAHTLALGTTAHAVIHHVTCPVLVAREHRHHRPWMGGVPNA